MAMTIVELTAQLNKLLDKLASIYEDYAKNGKDGAYTDPDGNPITIGDATARLEQRISYTRTALKLRKEIAGG